MVVFDVKGDKFVVLVVWERFEVWIKLGLCSCGVVLICKSVVLFKFDWLDDVVIVVWVGLVLLLVIDLMFVEDCWCVYYDLGVIV